MRSVAFLAVLLSLFAFACASSPSSTHFDLAKRASCNTKSCLTTRYIAQNKSVKTLQRSFSQTVAAEKKATALLKRAVKGGKKNAHKVSVFKCVFVAGRASLGQNSALTPVRCAEQEAEGGTRQEA